MEKYYDKETKTLAVPPEFNEELKDIPEGIEKIIFLEDIDKLIYSQFNQKIIASFFSNSITHLALGTNFNQKVDNLPSSITHLIFGYVFNQDVFNLPKNLTYLAFGGLFNKTVNYLPKNLTHLIFGRLFNQKVNNLPSSITHLIFGLSFNQPIDNLPKNLTHLTFGSDFNPKVSDFILPKNLKCVIFWSHNNIKNNLPESTEEVGIRFSHCSMKKIENLPNTLKKIKVEDAKYIDLIKVPFGCELEIQNFFIED